MIAMKILATMLATILTAAGCIRKVEEMLEVWRTYGEIWVMDMLFLLGILTVGAMIIYSIQVYIP